MDKPISVGDLVVVARQHCCSAYLGKVMTVHAIVSMPAGYHCTQCSASIGRAIAADGGNSYTFPMAWLKRIPPLSELEGERTQEDIREPA
jgi:hypothetical protein